jgi:hypothetical protein
MATDSISGLEKEVTDFLAVLNPQVLGNENFIRTQITGELRSAIQSPPLAEMHERQRRSNGVLEAIDALLAAVGSWEEHGGAAPMAFVLPAEVMPEYTKQMSNLAAGSTVFATTPALAPAEAINVTMAPPRDDLASRSTQRRS